MRHIDSSEISVVVQGAISDKFTKRVLVSIRKYLPKSEIILSTWKGSDVSNLDYDILVENEDPGAILLFPQWKQYHNLNRQIVSTKNGIARASKKYILKIRTDIVLKNRDFLQYFKKYSKRCEKLKILSERVLICENYVRKPDVLPFHISDWVFFGLKDDVKNIWDIPIAPEPQTTKYFYNHPLLIQHKENGPYSHFRHQYCAEQYIWSQFLKKNKVDFTFENMFDISYNNINLSKISMVNNLVILSCKEFGIKFLKGKLGDTSDIITNFIWKNWYKEYCDSSYVFSIRDLLSYSEYTKKYKEKLKKHYTAFFGPIKAFFRWFTDGLSLIYYSIKWIRKSINIIKTKNICSIKETKYFQNLLKNFPKTTKVVNILNLATGESYVLASLMQIKKQEDVIWCTTRKSTYSIFNLFQPNTVKYIEGINNFNFAKTHYDFNNVKFNIYMSDEFWFEFWKTKDSFINALSIYLNRSIIKEKYLSIKTKKQDEECLLKKIDKIKLNLNKFVFIAPEANSTNLLDKSFWNDIVFDLRKKGYDVFCNVMDNTNLVNNTKTTYLTFSESYILAQKAKCIISLRSGFVELLSTIDIPIFVIYNMVNNNKNRFLNNLYENYTLKNYPNLTSHLVEYKYEKFDQINDIKQNIILQINEIKDE